MKSQLFGLILCCITLSSYAHPENGYLVADTISIANENVNYKVTDNERYIMVDISTQDTKTIMTMLHHGVTVFFDLKGKDKEDVAVKYPLEPINMQMKPKGSRTDDFQTEAEVNQIKKNIKKAVSTDFPEEAEYIFFDKTNNFNVLLNSLDIKAVYGYNEKTGILTYQLTIPKSKLKEKSKSDFSKLKIGVKTEMPEKGKKSGPTESLEGGGGGRGGSGGRGGGGGGRSSQSQQGSDDGDSKGPTGIDFWFEAPM
ncbi:hypothetical protein [Formosa sp. PL04]|uniref:hypothetical protein n=1 Tax=Formosa sp. PL04 TaxID=3081755 RepID=UPI0029827584|nr:hypothetical protein [Formosa sp. PL04]MDW5288522.1 hypothetical protein [Formosa sp. PL04]